MPEFVGLGVCEKIITADNGTVSLISCLDSYSIPIGPGPVPDKLAVPLQWCVISLWRRLPSDGDREFEQRVELVMPNGEVALAGDMKFKLHHSTYRCMIPQVGFPIGQAGEYLVKLSLHEVGSGDWKVLAHYPIRIEHVSAT